MALTSGNLTALLVVAAAIGIVTASGAFVTVNAERTVTADVRGDAAALLGLEPYDGPNGWNGGTAGASEGYADITDGTLVVNLGGFDGGTPAGHGLNPDAYTAYDNVFTITNNGENQATITLHLLGDYPQYVTLYRDDTYSYDEANNMTGPSHAFTLESGESVTVSIGVDLVGVDFSGPLEAGDALIDTISITANEGSTGGSAGGNVGDGDGGDGGENGDDDAGNGNNGNGDNGDDDAGNGNNGNGNGGGDDEGDNGGGDDDAGNGNNGNGGGGDDDEGDNGGGDDTDDTG